MIGEHDLGMKSEGLFLWLQGQKTSHYFSFEEIGDEHEIDALIWEGDKFHIPKEFFR